MRLFALAAVALVLTRLAAAQGSPHCLPPPLVLANGVADGTAAAAAPASPPSPPGRARRALLDVAAGRLPYYYNYGYPLGYYVPVGGTAVANAVSEANALAAGRGAVANAASEANAVAVGKRAVANAASQANAVAVGGRRRLADKGHFPGRSNAHGRLYGGGVNNGGGQALAQSLSNAQSVALGHGAVSNAVSLSNAQAQNAPGGLLGVWPVGGGGGGQAVAQSLSNAQSVALGQGAVSNAVSLSNAQAQNLGKRRLAETPPAAAAANGEFKTGSYASDDGKARAEWLVARSGGGGAGGGPSTTVAASSASATSP